MALVRLQCPACSAIVKVSEEIVAQHPIVRCAKCLGLVTVVTSRVVESVATPLAEPDDDVSFKPKKKKRKRQKTDFPIGMIVGSLVGLIVLVGLGFGIYYLVDSFGGSGPEKTVKKAVAIMQRMVDVLEGINSPEDVAKLQPKLADLERDAKEMAEEMRKVQTTIDPETNLRLMKKYAAQMQEMQSRIMALIMKLHQNPQIAMALRNRMGGVGFAGLGGIGGGMQMPDLGNQMPRNFPNNQPNNTPPLNQNPGPTQNHTLSMFENTLLSKNTLASSIPDILGNVRDSDSAEHATLTLDAMIPAIKAQDQNLKQYERKMEQERIESNTQVARNAQYEFKKIISEIRVHLDRIEKLPDMRLVHSKLARQLTEVGLYDGTSTSTTASNDKNSTESANPFQPTGSGNKSAGSKPPDANPFESAPSGNNTKNSSNENMNSELDGTISKLTSTDHFRKRDGIREINTSKVEEARKKEVLDALITLFDDSDVHQKVDVLKAFKKWATTQEDKNRISACTENLLKDPWAKKDTLRYLGENKITSAGKDVARLLKEPFERKEAAESLIAMGSETEKEVVPYLTDLDSQVRQMAIEVLARIGTRSSVPDLQRLLNDRAVGLAAKQAIQLINGRKK